jgi:hypothetical protein
MKLIRSPKDGDALDARLTMYPCRLEVVTTPRELAAPTSTWYGYVQAGSARLRAPRLDVRAEAGTFFCFPGEVLIEPAGVVVTVERAGFRGLATVGRIEGAGRLAYIDGCSDTILVSPPRLGDPVLNHLHFPAGIVQSPHIHPSVRLGVVARGEGTAYGPGAAGGGAWEEPLTPGCVFLLETHELHAFRTMRGAGVGGGSRGDGGGGGGGGAPGGAAPDLDVIAFHPDSDWGPTDAAHPMMNRTYVDLHGAKKGA